MEPDYTFGRLEATREVHDSADNGTVRLSVYVWKPIKNDRHEVVLVPPHENWTAR